MILVKLFLDIFRRRQAFIYVVLSVGWSVGLRKNLKMVKLRFHDYNDFDKVFGQLGIELLSLVRDWTRSTSFPPLPNKALCALSIKIEE